MKRLAIFLLTTAAFGLGIPVSAQTADTTSAWRYFPLEVGNVWEYELFSENCPWDQPCDPVEFDGHMRRSVIGDSTVEGTPYLVVRERSFSPNGQPGWDLTWLVYYDEMSASLYYRNNEGGSRPWPRGFSCPLDAPFGGTIDCPGDPYIEVERFSNKRVYVGTDTLVTTVKRYVGYLNSSTFAADLGEVYNFQGKFSTGWRRLTYARVDGVEYGTEQFPVAGEDAPAPVLVVALAVYPNPARDIATLTFTLDRPQRLTLAVHDVLGRRVQSDGLGTLPAGEGTYGLDLAALRPGVYLVHLAGDAGARATTRLVVN